MSAPAAGSADTIAGYRLGELLGTGGLGAVHATTGAGGRPLAIKVVRYGGDPTARARAERELAALMRLDDPGVVRLIDGGAGAELAYVVMPRLDGTSLRRLVDDGGLGPEAAIVLVAGMARGVAAMHAAGLVHRDLKPDNAILTENGRVVVIDLGLALDATWTRQTQDGAIAGSVPYLAPEQIEGEAGPRSDVWACGVILYELCAGVRPFARNRAPEEVAAILAGARRPIGELDRRASAQLHEVIERCLARDPAARFADAGEVAAALDQLVTAAADGAAPAAILRRLFHDRARWQREVAAREAARAAAEAMRHAEAGDPFAAMRAIDRGLAYQPDHPALQVALTRALPPTTAPESAPVAPPAAAVAPAPARVVSPPRARSWRWPAIAAGAIGLGAIAGIGALATRGTSAPTVDHRDPRAVVEALFTAARTGDPSALSGLCMNNFGDKDVHELCEIERGSVRYDVFRDEFRDGRVLRVERSWAGAQVEFAVGGRTETMNLTIIGGRYYLESF